MTLDSAAWTYCLAPDVDLDRQPAGTVLHSPAGRLWLDARDELAVLDRLAGAGSSEAQIQAALRRPGHSKTDTDAACAALLFRLDGLGLLVRSLVSEGRRLASCVPLRPAGGPPPEGAPTGPLRLSRLAFARADGPDLAWQTPGSWARLTVHDRALLPVLHDLAGGSTASGIVGAATGRAAERLHAFLALVAWCGLLDGGDGDGNGDARQDAWPQHDLLFHTRTRRGYARALLGKTGSAAGLFAAPATAPPAAPAAASAAAPPKAPAAAALAAAADRGPLLALEPPDLARLFADDPPHALVSQRRQSTRQQGDDPVSLAQLSELLFRTLHESGGRRPYPSGGACYPLTAYLAVRRCQGLAPGLYAYEPRAHALARVGEPGPGLDELLADAAAAANVVQSPQVLLVLAARCGQTHRVYGDLGYSLILKEVGAVFQTLMMAAAAMALGACPLGCGNSRLFADLSGQDELTEVSVGEMMLGSMAPPG